MDKKDEFIRKQLQQDNYMPDKVNNLIKNFEGGIRMEEKPKEKKVLKINLQQAVLAFSSVVIVGVLGGNLYAHIQGKPNIYSAVKSLFVKEDKYAASEIIIDQTVECNGIKLTLKTVAMDENVLITKYIAEGEKLSEDFYTYNEFEEDMIDLAKIKTALLGRKIGEEKYDSKNKATLANEKDKKIDEILNKLVSVGIALKDANELLNSGDYAYDRYIGSQLHIYNDSNERINERISEVIAKFETKVSSKYEIISSNDTLQNFDIKSVSSKIERSGNQYVIYNVYNVDTISDLASKFKLNVNINKIGSTEGNWKFNTELEKARLDTRVETIDFYENNSVEIKDRDVTVSVKRLVISDFSSVLMIQTNTNGTGKYDKLIPYTFVVMATNKNNEETRISATSKFTEDTETGKYTDRIILDKIDYSVENITVNIYSKDGKLLDIISLPNIRGKEYNKPVELTQGYTNKKFQISFKYPTDWGTDYEGIVGDGSMYVQSPEDVDGNVASFVIRYLNLDTSGKEDRFIEYEKDVKLKDLIPVSENAKVLEEGKTTIAGQDAYYMQLEERDRGEKHKEIVTRQENRYYRISCYAPKEELYTRYEEAFNKMLETIQFVEPEKSYRTFSGDLGLETVKLYEDNSVIVTLNSGTIDKWKNSNMDEAYYPNGKQILENTLLDDNIEYKVEDVNNKIKKIYVFDKYTPCYILILTENDDLYYVKTVQAISTGKFKTIKIASKVFGDVYRSMAGIIVPIGTNGGNKEEYVLKGPEENIGLSLWAVTDTKNMAQFKQYVINYKGSEIIENPIQNEIIDNLGEISQLEITEAPNRTVYTEGEKFDRTGMKITATYSDGTKSEITDYKIYDGENLEAGQEYVTIHIVDGDRELNALDVKQPITVKN